MKVRNGFVSNSSSSSFIIAIDASNKCPCCGRSDMNILDIVEQVNTTGYVSTKLISRGAEETIKYWKHNIGFDETNPEKRWEDIFNKIKKFESDGKEIGTIQIENGDETMFNLLEKQVSNEYIIYRD